MTSDKARTIRDIGSTFATAHAQGRGAVVFVRCDGPATREDASASLTGLESSVTFCPVHLVGLGDRAPLDVFREACSGARKPIVLVRSIDDDAVRRLDEERDAFDRARASAIFLVTPAEARLFGRLCPRFWEARDRFVAWPTDPTDATQKDTGGKERQATRISDRIDAADAMPEGPDRAEALFRAARDAFNAGHADRAERGLVSAIDALKRYNMQQRVAECYDMLGASCERRNDIPAAEAWYEQSLALWQESNDTMGLATAYGHLGSVRFRRDDVEGALRYLSQALKQEELIGDPRRLCDATRRMGMVREREGSHTDAATMFHRALALAEQVNDQGRLSRCYHHLARVKERVGLPDDALDLYKKSYDIKLALGDEMGMAATLHQIGNVHFQRAEYEQAIDVYRQALAREAHAGDIRGKAATLVQLGLVLEQRFDYAEGFRQLLRARPLLRKLRSAIVEEVNTHIRRCRGMLTEDRAREIETEVERGERQDDAPQQKAPKKESTLHQV